MFTLLFPPPSHDGKKSLQFPISPFRGRELETGNFGWREVFSQGAPRALKGKSDGPLSTPARLFPCSPGSKSASGSPANPSSCPAAWAASA